jgi:predicted nucleic acid-binding protein
VIALLDTNILVALLAGDEVPPDLSGLKQNYVSSLTWAEMTRGLNTTPSIAHYKARARRLQVLQDTYGEGLAFDDECVEMLGEILDRVIQRGGDPRAHQMDRMIAATAMANELTLVTRNTADFRILDGLLDVIER